MAKEYFDKLSKLIDELKIEEELSLPVEVKHFFSGAVPATFEAWDAGWAHSGSPAAGLSDAYTVALHEIGHALGLTSSVADVEASDHEYDFNSDFLYGAVQPRNGSKGSANTPL